MMYMHMYVHMFKLAFAFIHTCMTMYMSKFLCIIQFIPLLYLFLLIIHISLFNMYVYEVLHVYMYMPYMMFTMYNLVAL